MEHLVVNWVISACPPVNRQRSIRLWNQAFAANKTRTDRQNCMIQLKLQMLPSLSKCLAIERVHNKQENWFAHSKNWIFLFHIILLWTVIWFVIVPISIYWMGRGDQLGSTHHNIKTCNKNQSQFSRSQMEIIWTCHGQGWGGFCIFHLDRIFFLLNMQESCASLYYLRREKGVQRNPYNTDPLTHRLIKADAPVLDWKNLTST